MEGAGISGRATTYLRTNPPPPPHSFQPGQPWTSRPTEVTAIPDHHFLCMNMPTPRDRQNAEVTVGGMFASIRSSVKAVGIGTIAVRQTQNDARICRDIEEIGKKSR
jgi:hypothetical protein